MINVNSIMRPFIMHKRMLLLLVLLACTVAVYAQTAGHQFINFDDPLYVTNNPAVKDGIKLRTISWAFTSTFASNWHPVTWLSHMLDVELFGLNPGAHHLVSVGFHVASTVLLYLLLFRMTAAPWKSLFVASLFALHPLHVESVAWVAERKDVLSGLFWHLTLLLYVLYAEKPAAGRYAATLACFSVGLMAKPMLVTLPVVMLMLDYWPLARFPHTGNQDRSDRTLKVSSLIKEKIPFLALSALSSVISISVQRHGGAMADLEKAPITLRIANAVISYARYSIDTFWPHDMAVLYPFPTYISPAELLGAALLLVLITGTILYSRRRFPWLLVGCSWFLVTLLPVIGLVQVGGQSHADRYTYIPLTGLFIIIAWGVPRLLEPWRWRQPALAVLAAGAIAAMTAVTWHQTGYWKDDITLYRHTLDVTENNYLILNNYGIALDQSGDFESAMRLYQEALRIWPKSAFAHNNLGAVLARKGRYGEAIGHYQEALRLNPDYVMAMVNMGKAFAGLGRNDEAMAWYEQALRRDPDSGDAHLNIALFLMKKGLSEEALQHYQSAVRLNPSSASAPVTMAVELAQAGRLQEAEGFFRQAVEIAPDSLEAQFNMGVFLAKQGRSAEAAEHFAQALRIRPDSAAARQWLERLGRVPSAGQ